MRCRRAELSGDYADGERREDRACAADSDTAAVSGGGEVKTTNDSATDVTAITQVADLTMTKTHTGAFTQGQTGATYTLTVSNGGTGPTSGAVAVIDTLPEPWP